VVAPPLLVASWWTLFEFLQLFFFTGQPERDLDLFVKDLDDLDVDLLSPLPLDLFELVEPDLTLFFCLVTEALDLLILFRLLDDLDFAVRLFLRLGTADFLLLDVFLPVNVLFLVLLGLLLSDFFPLVFFLLLGVIDFLPVSFMRLEDLDPSLVFF